MSTKVTQPNQHLQPLKDGIFSIPNESPLSFMVGSEHLEFSGPEAVFMGDTVIGTLVYGDTLKAYISTERRGIYAVCDGGLFEGEPLEYEILGYTNPDQCQYDYYEVTAQIYGSPCTQSFPYAHVVFAVVFDLAPGVVPSFIGAFSTPTKH